MINLSSFNSRVQPRELENADLQRLAPSVFARRPWGGVSEKYRFIPSIEIVDALRDAGFYPVRAQQSTSRIPGKREFTKHMLRFRMRGADQPQALGDVIAEAGFTNSHDLSACFDPFGGLFRLACLNGMVTAINEMVNYKTRHVGARDIVQSVLDSTLAIFRELPKSLERAARWKTIELSPEEQEGFAVAALPLLDSTLEISPAEILRPRRDVDRDRSSGAHGAGTYYRPAPDLWRTFNVVQENMIKGGARALSTTGRWMHTRSINSVDRDLKLNKALWTLTEKMAELKTAA